MPCSQQCTDSESAAATPGPQKRASRAAGPRKRKRSNDPPTLIPTGELTDAERDRLHVELHEYLRWLSDELAELETSPRGRTRVATAGMNVRELGNVLVRMEAAFRCIREHRRREQDKACAGTCDENGGGTGDVGAKGDGSNDPADGDAGSSSEKENASPSSNLPLLERSLAEDLQAAMPREAEEAADHVPRRPPDFEELYASLRKYRKEHGHARVPGRHKDGRLRLGSWVSELRSARRRLTARGREHEGPGDGGRGAFCLVTGPRELGLRLQYCEVGHRGVLGWIVAAIGSECPFKDQVVVGDRLTTIDGVWVKSLDDLKAGKDKEERVFEFSRDGGKQPVLLTKERCVSLTVIQLIGLRFSPILRDRASGT